MMIWKINPAVQYLSHGSYTGFRRVSGRPVRLEVKPLGEIPKRAVTQWRDYRQIESLHLEAVHGPELTLQPALDHRLFIKEHFSDPRFALWDPEADALQGFVTISLEGGGEISGLYSAPWNYAARLAVDRFRTPTGYWRQNAEGRDKAVRGSGWILMSYALAYLNEMSRYRKELFPLLLLVEMGGDALDFYQDKIQLSSWRGISEITAKFVRGHLRQALIAEEQGRPGWKG